ncbi:FG-GAP repeat domain-containing protein [Nonomuraea coxensis]|uniref:FG-GAP repeat domain-containing protein n=1 Tax=Nonomuraea coxensis TaxID=404386 RepID=UPI0012F744D7|nr:VCBS repeat-containing protein [Nonomuraea coxensis]
MNINAAYQLAPCDSNGTTSTDAALATQLNSTLKAKMRGYMSAYRVSCARMVIKAVRDRGLAPRAAVIAIATIIVETSIQNISEMVDHDSLGLFQQRASWGTSTQRLNPTWATNAFLDKMIRLYPNNSWATAPIGQVCQAVQVSDYPDRYQGQAGDAQIIVDTISAALSKPDFSGDGKADVIVRNASTKNLHLYQGNGSGGFKAGTGDQIGTNWGAFDVIFSPGDFNGDGKADVIARNSSTKDLHLYLGNGSGGFKAGTGDQIGTNWGAFDVIFSPGDFNGDGDADVIVRNASTKDLHLYLGNGSGGFKAGTGDAIGNNWGAFDTIFSPGDFSGDGKADVVVRNASTKDLHLYQGNGSGGFKAGTGDAIGNNWGAFDTIFSPGDFSGDGKADVVVRNASTKDLHLYQGNGSGGFKAGTGDAIGNNWGAFDTIF